MYFFGIIKLLCIFVMSKNNKAMENPKEIMAITRLLTEPRLQKKMVEFNLYNAKGLSQRQINSHLDEKLRIDKAIKKLEEKLRELED